MKRRLKEKSSCSYVRPERLLQRRNLDFHFGAQPKHKRQWLQAATREILVIHRKIFFTMSVAKPLEQDAHCGTAIPGDFQTPTGLGPEHPDLDLKLALLGEMIELHDLKRILPTQIFLLFYGIFYTGTEKKGSVGLGYVWTIVNLWLSHLWTCFSCQLSLL